MRNWRLSLSLLLTVALGAVPMAAVGQTIYDNDRPGWEAAVFGNFNTEDFTDAVFNPGVSVTTDLGFVDTTTGVWWDKLDCPTGTTTTTWHFAQPIVGFGGTWNPGIPGGPGAGIEVAINGSWVVIGEIPNTYVNIFWGFVSPTPFTDVRLRGGSVCASGALTERYELDDMVYSGLNLYVTGGGKVGAKKPEWTFGGSVGYASDGSAVGQFQLNDHANGVAYHTTEILSLVFSGPEATTPPASYNTAVFVAEFSGNDGSTKLVRVTIQDIGEGSPQADTIQLAGDLVLPETVLKGGNFQVHEDD